MGLLDGLVGSLVGGVSSLLGGSAANASSAESVDKQIDFQREMSATAHQREVKDLEAAGLNPILSAGGSGASTPSGASYTAHDVLSPAVSTAMQTSQISQQLKNLKSEGDKLEADASSARLDRDRKLQDYRMDFASPTIDSGVWDESPLKSFAWSRRMAELDSIKTGTSATALSRDLARYSIPGLKNDARGASEYGSNPLIQFLKQVSPTVSPFIKPR